MDEKGHLIFRSFIFSHFQPKQMIHFSKKSLTTLILGTLGFFSQKFDCFSFELLWTPDIMQNINNKKLKSQFQSWFIRASRKSELVNQQEMTIIFKWVLCVCVCVCACLRACVWRGEHESWIQHVKQILRFSKRKRFSWNRIFSLLVFVL